MKIGKAFLLFPLSSISTISTVCSIMFCYFCVVLMLYLCLLVVLFCVGRNSSVELWNGRNKPTEKKLCGFIYGIYGTDIYYYIMAFPSKICCVNITFKFIGLESDRPHNDIIYIEFTYFCIFRVFSLFSILCIAFCIR